MFDYLIVVTPSLKCSTHIISSEQTYLFGAARSLLSAARRLADPKDELFCSTADSAHRPRLRERQSASRGAELTGRKRATKIQPKRRSSPRERREYPLRQRQRDVRRDLAASEPPIAFTKDQHGIGLAIPRLRAVLHRTGIPVISISEKEKLKNHKVFV